MAKRFNAELHAASLSGDTEGIARALAAGARSDSYNEDGMCALHVAACSGNTAAVKQLADAGAKLDRGREEDERTALHCVCDEGSGLEVAECLLSAGCNPNARDMSGWAPLHCAAYMGSSPYVQLLLRHAAEADATNDAGQTPLMLASEACATRWAGKECDYAAVVEALLAAGADPNRKDHCGEAPLHLAVRAKETAVVAALCRGGAHVEARTGDLAGRSTALHLSCALGDTSTLQLLAASGADLEAADGEAGLTPLQLAAQLGQQEAAQALLGLGASPCTASPSGLTAVHLAAQEGHTALLRTLLLHPQQAAAKSAAEGCEDVLAGVTVTAGPAEEEARQGHAAAQAGFKGLPLSATESDTAGLSTAATSVPSALHMACYGGHAHAAELLLSHGHDARAIDAALDTPLHVACRAGHGDVVQLLLSSAAGKQAAGMRNARGQLPAELAAPGGPVEHVLKAVGM